MLLRTSSLAIVLFTTATSLAATPPTGPQDPPPLPDGQPVIDQWINFDRAAGFSRDFIFQSAGSQTEQAFIYPNGLIALEERLDEDFHESTGPFSERPAPATPIIAPLMAELGGSCPGWAEDEATAFNRVEYLVEDDDLIVIWRAMLPAEPDCSSKLESQASTFTARLSWGATFDVTFTYYRLAPNLQPRAGVLLPQGALELAPDEGKLRTDRGLVLATDGSEGDPGTADRARSWIRGLWIMSFDARGQIVGDEDRDGIRTVDNCLDTANPSQRDLDLDGRGNACDDDLDGDEDPNLFDNCVYVANPLQEDLDNDRIGDACDWDDDGDGVFDASDNCPLTANPMNLDLDDDGIGDSCDADIDGDDAHVGGFDVLAWGDRCPHIWDPDRKDSDLDGIGDACDLAPWSPCPNAEWCRFEVDSDGDGIANIEDNCPVVPNPVQSDSDGDDLGNACDWDCNGDDRLDRFQPSVRAACQLVDHVIAVEPFPIFTPGD